MRESFMLHMYGAQFAVDLNTHTCSCSKWDLCGPPCIYGLAAISRQQRSPMQYVYPTYKRKAYERDYENFISPMSSEDLWIKTHHRPIKPPVYHKQAGKPKKCRVREPYKIPRSTTRLRRYDMIIHCRRCGQQGHNAINCQADGGKY